MSESTTSTPTFAVMKAGGGKARILAIRPGGFDDDPAVPEAVAITTVPDLDLAVLLAGELNDAWNGFGPFDPDDLADVPELPQPIYLALEQAQEGCPPADPDRAG